MADVLRLTLPMTPSTDAIPLAVDARALAPLLTCGVRTIRTWDAAGKLPEPLRISGKVLWRLDEIKAWLEAGAPNRERWAAIRAARMKTNGSCR